MRTELSQPVRTVYKLYKHFHGLDCSSSSGVQKHSHGLYKHSHGLYNHFHGLHSPSYELKKHSHGLYKHSHGCYNSTLTSVTISQP
jgi:hypothetical protein